MPGGSGEGSIGGGGGGFVPGVRLADEFYSEVVRPLLEAEFPGLGYAAALIGAGSEVLGFDSERSTDHDWGPRLLVFLEDEEAERLGVAVDEMLGRRLPEVFGGYPVAFGVTRDPGSGIGHRVEVFGLGGWLAWRLGFDPRGGVTVPDWLAAPWQRLAEVTGGAVFHDGTGGLTRARAALSWYPRDVWRYVLSCQWSRIAEEEAFPGRCAEAGDELGSVVVTARLARDLMRLWLLMQRRYPPYSKWLGSAFARASGGAAPGWAVTWPRRWRRTAGAPGSGNSAWRTGSPPRPTTGSGSPSPSTPAPGPTSTGRTGSSAPGASPPPCPGHHRPAGAAARAGRLRGSGHRQHVGPR